MAEHGQLYRFEIKASGEVRDKDGNLLNADVEAVGVEFLTEDELRQRLEELGAQS